MTHQPILWRVGRFGVTPKLRFAPSPGPAKEDRPVAPWLTKMAHVPHILVDLKGDCIYASVALATLLQCGVHELHGQGWRPRLSPGADRPFNTARALVLAQQKTPIRLMSPDGKSALVSRIMTVTDPADPTRVTGFYGRVQHVRVLHRRIAAAAGGLVFALLTA